MGEQKFFFKQSCQMTKMATMPIYGKNLKKSSSPEPKGRKLDMQHRVLEYYQVCSNDDPGLTLTYCTARSNLVPYAFEWEKGKTMDFYTPPQKSGRVLCYTLGTFLSIHQSVSASFPDSNLSSFWPIFFKLSMDIDIGEEWFGIANGLNSFINNRVMALDWRKNVFFLNIFRTNGWILIKFCICIDIYKIHVVSNALYFWSVFNKPLIGVRILFMLNILWINLCISIKFCTCIYVDIDKM